MLDAQTLLPGLQHRLDGVLLGPVHDVLDHRPGVEILEVHDFLVTIGIGDLQEPVVVDLGIHPVDDLLDHRLDGQGTVAGELVEVIGVDRQVLGQILREDVLRGFGVGAFDLDLHVQAARPQDGRVDHVLAVGGADHDDVLQALDAVDLAQQLRNHGGLHIGAHAGAAGPEDGVHLVEEDDHGRALGRLLPGALEDQPDVPLGFTHELVEQFGTLDVEEVTLGFPGVLAPQFGHLLGQRIRDGLGDQRLTAAGRTVEQHTLGRTQRVFAVEVLVQERQLHGIADLLDLAGQTTDIAVADVGDLLKHEILDLGLRNALEGVSGLGVHQQRIAGPKLARLVVLVELRLDTLGQELGGHQRFGQPDDTFLIGMADDEGAVPVGQDLAQRADLTDGLEGARLHDGQCLVEADRLALLEDTGVDIGRQRQAHLAAGGEDVDGLVLIGRQQHPVPAGRLTEPVDLLAQGEQLLAGLLERVHQLGIARGQGVDARLKLLHVAGGTQPAAGPDGGLELFTQGGRFSAQPLQFSGVRRGQVRLVGCSETLRTLGLTHVALPPAPDVGAVTTSTLPAIQPLCAV